MENFSNLIITPDNLPEIDKDSFNPLDKKYKTILYLRLIITVVIVAGTFAAFYFFVEEKPPVLITGSIIAVAVLIAIYSVVIITFGFIKKGYLVRENDISFQKGLIIFTSTSVPFNRIQHVEVSQGILAKIFKLSVVKIYTAGGSTSDLSIPGLPAETAVKLKDFLSEKISRHE
jgi:membrane protein YdbS with pleckstrin-like domain